MGLPVDDQPSHSPPPTVVSDCPLRVTCRTARHHSLATIAWMSTHQNEQARNTYQDHANVSGAFMLSQRPAKIAMMIPQVRGRPVAAAKMSMHVAPQLARCPGPLQGTRPGGGLMEAWQVALCADGFAATVGTPAGV